MIKSGIEVSSLIQLDDRVTKVSGGIVELRRADGALLGLGQIAPPPRGRSTRVAALPRWNVQDRFAVLNRLAGSDPALHKSVKRLKAVVNLDLPVLLHGETGSGKDVFARAIHAASNRAGQAT